MHRNAERFEMSIIVMAPPELTHALMHVESLESFLVHSSAIIPILYSFEQNVEEICANILRVFWAYHKVRERLTKTHNPDKQN